MNVSKLPRETRLLSCWTDKNCFKNEKKKLYECTNIIEILCLEMNVYVLLKNIFTIETNSPQQIKKHAKAKLS